MLLLPRLPHRTVVASVAQREAVVGHTAAAVAELAGEALLQRNTLVQDLLPVPIVELVEEALQFQLLFVFVAVEVLLVAVLVIE